MLRSATRALRQSNLPSFSTTLARLLQNEASRTSPSSSTTPPLSPESFLSSARPIRANGIKSTPNSSSRLERTETNQIERGTIPTIVTRKPITSYGQLPSSFGKNQIIEVPQEVRKTLEEIVKSFQAPIRYAFAYGSGVFQQSGYTAAVRISFRSP